MRRPGPLPVMKSEPVPRVEAIQRTLIRIMPADSAVPRLALREPLTRFFRMDRDASLPLEEAAVLLGMTRQGLQRIVDGDGVLPVKGMLSWEEVAHQLFTVWPRAELLSTLGADGTHRIPPLLFPTTVSWQIPVYIQMAMEQQARRTTLPFERGISDYVADLLHIQIDEQTERAMRSHRAFRDAFLYPHEREIV